MKKVLLASSVVALLAAGCNWATLQTATSPAAPISKQPMTIKQGVYGTVTLTTGDCMPGSDTTNCSSKGVSTQVYIREPVTEQSSMDGVYLQTPSKLVKEVSSSDSGFYETTLPVGTYSVFVEDGGKEYCNLFTSQGVCLVTVGSLPSEYDPRIDHAAH